VNIDEETGTSAKEGLLENRRVGWSPHALSPNCLKEGSMLACVQSGIKSWCQNWLNLLTLSFLEINQVNQI
jgi:hypothetical protein